MEESLMILAVLLGIGLARLHERKVNDIHEEIEREARQRRFKQQLERDRNG